MKHTVITNKQQELLLLFPRFRFLTRYQIQLFMKHKDKKTIQEWINTLLKNRYLEKVVTKNTKVFPPQPGVYFLGKTGRVFLYKQQVISDSLSRNVYYDKNRSPSFIHTNLLLADICLSLAKQDTSQAVFLYSTRAEYSNTTSAWYFLIDLHPHLCFPKKGARKRRSWYLLEIFPHAFPNQAIRKRIHAYVTFLHNKTYTEAEMDMPIILFICVSKEMKRYIRQYLKRKLIHYEIDDYDISLTLEEQVKTYGLRGNIWDEV